MTENVRLSPGDPAPEFTLPDADGTAVSLSDFRGRSLVIYCYPAASTPGCTKQACDFRDNLTELDRAGFAVVGISPDEPAKLAKFRDARGLTFPLLSDPDRAVLTAYGAFGEKKMYGRTVTGSSARRSSSTRRAASSVRSTTCAPPVTSPSSARTSRSE